MAETFKHHIEILWQFRFTPAKNFQKFPKASLRIMPIDFAQIVLASGPCLDL